MAITIVKPEDLKDYVGKDIGNTEWFKVDQDRINTVSYTHLRAHET